ncbi:hypothetical protein F4818DRAFT_398979 [Hypoxylon cercidicola]|nr:hypothetical protein F4818DRAFT_398979 [Hypoxylon cercidicola]
MADQCIVCLENLDVQSPPPAQLQISPEDELSQSSPSESGPVTTVVASTPAQPSPKSPSHNTSDVTDYNDQDNKIAVIQICGHALHDACLQEWTGKANSCPICRQAFHLVHVYDKVGGTLLSSYKVEDKKQTAEFDPQAWLDENPEIEEEEKVCPLCSRADHEELLLLCDSCDSAYHTYCVDLDHVPRGHWFCMECINTGAEMLAEHLQDPEADSADFSDGSSGYLPRTQASMRQARRQARSNEWQGAWGQIAGRVWDALNLDLDNHDDDEALRNYRRAQQQRERNQLEYNRWQQRLNIASRLGARDVFASNLSNVLPQPIARPRPPPPPRETVEERQAWGALEKAMEADNPNHSTTSRRKRKSRSVTASPIEPPQQPERKLKRPRTRRAPTTGEGSSSNSRLPHAEPSTSTSNRPGATAASPTSPPPTNGEAPSFLSSLLKEVEMSAPSDDENVRTLFSIPKPVTDPSSPASSPSPSAYSSPRALSTTPPPRAINDRPGSPLSLSSHIEPIYPPSNFLANRTQNGDHSDSESRSRQQTHHHNGTANGGSPEIHQPRPRRQHSARYLSRPQETSPTRTALPFEMKESITGIVKDALKPHWKSGHITADQYASINRDLSHKLYKEVSDDSLNENARQRFEKIATQEVARAIADLKT